ncbi:MAG: hypothetical protein R3272_07605 [Candidatus Promineifilaceae bacterium]|nr:hypothetical protein [Candidatus Promineifilaceae bacterium]
MNKKMKVRGQQVRIVVAVIIILSTLFWAFNRVRERSYTGAQFAIPVGSGEVAVTNPGSEPLTVQMRANGRMANFTIASSELGLRQRGTRVGRGDAAYYQATVELPPGTATLDVVRGNKVRLLSGSTQEISATVTPLTARGERITFRLAAIVVLSALFYISRLLEHRWLRSVVAIPARTFRRAAG